MRIGIVGAGAVGRTLARLWAEAGREVMLSSRHPERIAADAAAVGARSGRPEEAASWGEAVLLAVNYWTVDEAADAIRGAAAGGKVVIDATNPLRRAEGGGVERVIGDSELAAQLMAAKLPGARLVKAFTTMWTGHLEQHARRPGEPAAVALAGDDADAKRLVAGLVQDAGFAPVDLGGLADSRPLDPPSPIWNRLLTAAEVRERAAAMRPSAAAQAATQRPDREPRLRGNRP